MRDFHQSPCAPRREEALLGQAQRDFLSAGTAHKPEEDRGCVTVVSVSRSRLELTTSVTGLDSVTIDRVSARTSGRPQCSGHSKCYSQNTPRAPFGKGQSPSPRFICRSWQYKCLLFSMTLSTACRYERAVRQWERRTHRAVFPFGANKAPETHVSMEHGPQKFQGFSPVPEATFCYLSQLSCVVRPLGARTILVLLTAVGLAPRRALCGHYQWPTGGTGGTAKEHIMRIIFHFYCCIHFPQWSIYPGFTLHSSIIGCPIAQKNPLFYVYRMLIDVILPCSGVIFGGVYALPERQSKIPVDREPVF